MVTNPYQAPRSSLSPSRPPRSASYEQVVLGTLIWLSLPAIVWLLCYVVAWGVNVALPYIH